jgi:antitoxin (DNA-binding transcriptional repressor) of toxin-antitoxin stability system
MKTASIREVQHDLKHILCWIQAGETVTITKRNHPVAELRPTSKESPVKRPNFKERLLETFHQELSHPSNAELIVEERCNR